MSWNPDQGQTPGGQDPYSGYGTPQNPYGTPENPYQNPQNPYATPPAPENPYAPPPAPENPYAPPPAPENPYAPQNPYAGASYGGGYQQGQQAFGYEPPRATPLPLGQAIQQLPNQYIKILTHPSAQTFTEEIGKADWGIVWVQLIIYAVIAAFLAFAGSLISPFNTSNINSSGVSAAKDRSAAM